MSSRKETYEELKKHHRTKLELILKKESLTELEKRQEIIHYHYNIIRNLRITTRDELRIAIYYSISAIYSILDLIPPSNPKKKKAYYKQWLDYIKRKKEESLSEELLSRHNEKYGTKRKKPLSKKERDSIKDEYFFPHTDYSRFLPKELKDMLPKIEDMGKVFLKKYPIREFRKYVDYMMRLNLFFCLYMWEESICSYFDIRSQEDFVTRYDKLQSKYTLINVRVRDFSTAILKTIKEIISPKYEEFYYGDIRIVLYIGQYLKHIAHKEIKKRKLKLKVFRFLGDDWEDKLRKSRFCRDFPYLYPNRRKGKALNASFPPLLKEIFQTNIKNEVFNQSVRFAEQKKTPSYLNKTDEEMSIYNEELNININKNLLKQNYQGDIDILDEEKREDVDVFNQEEICRALGIDVSKLSEFVAEKMFEKNSHLTNPEQDIDKNFEELIKAFFPFLDDTKAPSDREPLYIGFTKEFEKELKSYLDEIKKDYQADYPERFKKN